MIEVYDKNFGSAPGIRTSRTTCALMENVGPSTLVKRFNHLTHATQAKTAWFMKEGGAMTEEVRKEIE